MALREQPPGEEAWYLVSRVSAVRGKDLRDAQPNTDQNGQPTCISS